ncbi:MAG: delta-60 repeat domain-containing protein [Candidatus Dependentiae bacterium]
MKRLLIILLFLGQPLFGMGLWEKVKQWFTQTPQEQLQCPEFRDFPQTPVEPFSFQKLPLEIQTLIILATANAASLDKATQTIRALSQTNKELNQILNDEQYNKTIARELSRKYGASPLIVQLYLNTEQFLQKTRISDHELFKVYQEAQFWNSIHNSKRSNAIVRVLYNTIENLRDSEKLEKVRLMHGRIIWVYKDNYRLRETFHGANDLNLSVTDKNGKYSDIYGGIINELGPDGLITSTRDEKLKTSITYNIYSEGELYTAMQKDDKLLLAGLATWNGEYILLRFNTDGSVDSTFGTNGIVKTGIIYSPADEIRWIDYLKSKNKYKELEALLDLIKIRSYLTINPQNGDLIFKFKNAVKKYTVDGKEIK